MPQSRGQVEWNALQLKANWYTLKPNYKEYWKALVYAFLYTVCSVFEANPCWKGFYDLCARMDTLSVAFMTSNIKGYINVHACVCSIWYILVAIKVEWQSAWSEVMKQQPYCPDPARGVLIFTVLKVQLGTSVLLTTTDFHHLIPCPVWLCRFCELSSHHITYSLLLSSINHMNCIPLKSLVA